MDQVSAPQFSGEGYIGSIPHIAVRRRGYLWLMYKYRPEPHRPFPQADRETGKKWDSELGWGAARTHVIIRHSGASRLKQDTGEPCRNEDVMAAMIFCVRLNVAQKIEKNSLNRLV